MERAAINAGRIVREVRCDIFLICVDRAEKRNGFASAMPRGLAEACAAYKRRRIRPLRHQCTLGVLVSRRPRPNAGRTLDGFGEPLFPDGCLDPLDLHAPHRIKPVVVAV